VPLPANLAASQRVAPPCASRSTVPWKCGVCLSADVNLGTQSNCGQCHAPFDRAANRVFMGQLRKENTAEYVRWMISLVAPDMIVHHVEAHTTKGEQRCRGAAFVHLDTPQDARRLCDLLNKRAFADTVKFPGGEEEEGLWLIEDDEAATVKLTAFAQKKAFAKDRPAVLPRQPIVVEERGKRSEGAQPYRPTGPHVTNVRPTQGNPQRVHHNHPRHASASHHNNHSNLHLYHDSALLTNYNNNIHQQACWNPYAAQYAMHGDQQTAYMQMPTQQQYHQYNQQVPATAGATTPTAKQTTQVYRHDPYAWNPFAANQQAAF